VDRIIGIISSSISACLSNQKTNSLILKKIIFNCGRYLYNIILLLFTCITVTQITKVTNNCCANTWCLYFFFFFCEVFNIPFKLVSKHA